MNWYIENKNIEKFSGVSQNIKKWLSMASYFGAPALIGLILHAGISNTQIEQIAKKNNFDHKAVEKELIEIIDLGDYVNDPGKLTELDKSFGTNYFDTYYENNNQKDQENLHKNNIYQNNENTNIEKEIFDEIKAHEGFRPRVYRDPLKDMDKDPNKPRTWEAPTIGYGFNLKGIREDKAREILRQVGADYDSIMDRGQLISKDQAEKIMSIMINDVKRQVLHDFPNFNNLHPDAQKIIFNMTYQMGSLSKWKNLRDALNRRNPDYQMAAREMLDSEWARSLRKLMNKSKDPSRKTRAEQLSEIMRSIK